MNVCANRWLVTLQPLVRPRVRLFCFPFAGGGASIYAAWGRSLAREGVEVCAVQFPGRENRLAEEPFHSLERLVEALTEELAGHLDIPFSFFGHSFGALTCFELTRALQRAGRELPRHLFVSGAKAPQLPRHEPHLHALPSAEFLDHVSQRYGGIPKEVLAEPELVAMILPSLQADFAAFETYQHEPGEPLKIPITAFGGMSDPLVSTASVQLWQQHTRHPFNWQLFPGNHFFLNTARPAVLAAVARQLESTEMRS